MRMQWDQIGEHFYEAGVSDMALYLIDSKNEYSNGVPWSGITNINENPSGAEANPQYADNIKYLNLYSAEEYGATIECFMYPDEFAACNGEAEITPGVRVGQQTRKPFGFAYKTLIGNDTKGTDAGYKLHLVYNAMASPSEKSHGTVNDNPEASTMSFEVTTTPVPVTDYKNTSSLEIDSRDFAEDEAAAKLKAFEDILYGVNTTEFDTSETYAVGDYVTYSSGSPATIKTYVCTTAVTVAGAWNEDNWDEVEKPGPRLPLPDEVASLLA